MLVRRSRPLHNRYGRWQSLLTFFGEQLRGGMITELDFWNQVKENLKSKNLNNRPLQMWFEPTALIGVEDRPTGRCFLLGVPTELHKYWITQNLFDRICSEVSALHQSPFSVEIVVTGDGWAPKPSEPLMKRNYPSHNRSKPLISARPTATAIYSIPTIRFQLLSWGEIMNLHMLHPSALPKIPARIIRILFLFSDERVWEKRIY